MYRRHRPDFLQLRTCYWGVKSQSDVATKSFIG